MFQEKTIEISPLEMVCRAVVLKWVSHTTLHGVYKPTNHCLFLNGLDWYIPDLSELPLQHRLLPLLVERSSYSLICCFTFKFVVRFFCRFFIFQLFPSNFVCQLDFEPFFMVSFSCVFFCFVLFMEIEYEVSSYHVRAEAELSSAQLSCAALAQQRSAI